jgi:hypothetical protein
MRRLTHNCNRVPRAGSARANALAGSRPRSLYWLTALNGKSSHFMGRRQTPTADQQGDAWPIVDGFSNRRASA